MTVDAPAPQAPDGILVTGHGTVQGAPDRMVARLACTAVRPTVADAVEASEQAAARVREALAADGVRGVDAATSGLSVQAEEAWVEELRRSEVTGYRAEHSLRVSLSDLDAAGAVLGRVVAAGGDDLRLQGVELAVHDDAGLRQRAREAAWADALQAAEQLAALAGRRLGAVAQVVEGATEAPFPPPGARMALVADSGAIGIQPGSVEIHASITVRWAFV